MNMKACLRRCSLSFLIIPAKLCDNVFLRPSLIFSNVCFGLFLMKCIVLTNILHFYFDCYSAGLTIQDVEAQMVILRNVQLGSGEKMFCQYWMNSQRDHRLLFLIYFKIYLMNSLSK